MGGEITRDALVASLKTRLDPHTLAELESAGVHEGVSADDMLYAVAAMIARAGEHRRIKNRARLIRNATGPRKATTSISVHFDDATGSDAYTLSAGQPLFQTRAGVRFVLSVPLARSSGEAAGVEVVDVEAQFAGLDANVTAEEISVWSIADQSNRASILWDVGTNAAKDEFLAGVRSGRIWFAADDDATGGLPGTLDLIGRGLGMLREDGESDELYRGRMVLAPEEPVDAISPPGVLRAVNRALGGDLATVKEYWDDGFFAFGYAGFGTDGFARKRFGVVYVPDAASVAPIQALVNEIRAIGYYILVLQAG